MGTIVLIQQIMYPFNNIQLTIQQYIVDPSTIGFELCSSANIHIFFNSKYYETTQYKVNWILGLGTSDTEELQTQKNQYKEN